MKEIDKKIEKCRAQLEELYLRSRAGERCMAEVLMLSVKLDGLLLYASGTSRKRRNINNRNLCR